MGLSNISNSLHRLSLLWILCIVFNLNSAHAKTIYQDLNVVLTNRTMLCESLQILTISGEMPGPTLYVNRGDTMIVTVHNQSPDNVTIHWHGMKQPRNPWSDGPEYVTQCGIPSGHNMTYTLLFSVEEGTIWYHAHSVWARATVHGAIVVYPKEGSTYPFQMPYKEFPIIIGEWWKRDMLEMLEYMTTTGAEPYVSDSFTLNGQPGDLLPCSKEGTHRFLVKKGKTYLFRLINAALTNPHFFAIANHTFTIVGRDGAYIKPFNTTVVAIEPGQTLDFLIEANQEQDSLYYMAARTYSDARALAYNNYTTTAIIEYESYNTSQSSSPCMPVLPDFDDRILVLNFTKQQKELLANGSTSKVPMNLNHSFMFVLSLKEFTCSENDTCNGPRNGWMASSINNISFVNPSTDVLDAYYNKMKGVYTDDFPLQPQELFNFTADGFPEYLLIAKRGTEVINLKYNETVEIVFQNTAVMGGENHPIHLHGYNFFEVGTGFGDFDTEKHPSSYNLVDPPYTNTVSVPYRGWSTIRFTADNPGVWLMHCHLARHLTWGMVAVFIVHDGPTNETSMLTRPSSMPNFCKVKLYDDQ